MTDQRDFDRNFDMDRRTDMEAGIGSGASTPWGWLAGAIFIIVVLALVFTSGSSTQTARNDVNPPATTGMAPRAMQPPMTTPPGTTTPPSTVPSTTGQAR
jgi:hypothetical protein